MTIGPLLVCFSFIHFRVTLNGFVEQDLPSVSSRRFSSNYCELKQRLSVSLLIKFSNNSRRGIGMPSVLSAIVLLQEQLASAIAPEV